MKQQPPKLSAAYPEASSCLLSAAGNSMNSRVLFISLYLSSLWKLVLILMTWKSKRLSYLRDLILGVWKNLFFFFIKKEKPVLLLFWAVSCNKCWTQWRGSHAVRKWQQQEKQSSELNAMKDGDRRNMVKRVWHLEGWWGGKTAVSQCGVPPRCLCPWSRRGFHVRASTLWRPQLSCQLIKLWLESQFGTVTFVGELWSKWLLSPKKTLKPLWMPMQIKMVARGPFTTEGFGCFLGESQSCWETGSWLGRSGSVVAVHFQESVGRCELKPRGTKWL